MRTQTFPGPADSSALPHVVPGLRYGFQTKATWAAGDVDEKQLLDTLPNEFLWRVTVKGSNLLLRVVGGSSSAQNTAGLLLPLEFGIAGQCSVSAVPLDSQQPAVAWVTCTVATAVVTVARRVVTALGALDTDSARATALAAATVTVEGTAVVLAPGDALPLAGRCALTAGGPILVEVAV